MNQCIICGKPEYSEGFCYDCIVLMGVIYTRYTSDQIMCLFGRILGYKANDMVTRPQNLN